MDEICLFVENRSLYLVFLLSGFFLLVEVDYVCVFSKESFLFGFGCFSSELFDESDYKNDALSVLVKKDV